MKIVVCIKQVPDAKDIQWTSQNTMKREGVESIINPCDLYAIEFALDCKKLFDENVEITAISMGPMQAQKVLREAVALGCDEAYLLCDKSFSGADTLATGYTLSQGIKKIIPDFDLIFCGQYASDGDTAQTGVQIAQNLNCNQITYSTEIIDLSRDYIIANQQCDTYIQTLKAKLPCVVCVNENKDKALLPPLIAGQIKAQDYEIKVLSAGDIEISEDKIGIKGSPTCVSNVFRPKHNRKGEIIESSKAIDTIKNIINGVLND